MNALLRRWPLMAAIAVMVLIAGGIGAANLTGSLFASDVTSGNLIEACENGQHLRIVSDHTECKNNEDGISWNQEGEKGDKGDSGTSSWQDNPGIVTTTVDVGIGTGDPGALLDVRIPGGNVLVVSNDNNNAPDLRLVSNNSDGAQIEWRETGSSRHFNIDQNTGVLRFFSELDDDSLGVVRMQLRDSSGVTLQVFGQVQATNIALISDARLKTDIQPITNPLEKILALRGVTFNWNPDSGFDESTQIGLIAQEVEKVLPELVTTGSDGYKAVYYSNIVAVLVDAIRELEARLAELEQR